MKSLNIFVLLVLWILVRRCNCETHLHTFVANTNFDNPDRWTDSDHSYPCAGDTIQFAPDQVISVFVQTNAAISEVILPMNGEFIFGDGVVWGVRDDLSPCSSDGHAHVVHFNSDPSDWFEPVNWKIQDSSGNELKDQDLLDIERVPCMYDEAEFQSTNSYTADITANAQLKSLTVSNEKMDSAAFNNHRNSEGKYQFIGSGMVTVEEDGCQDVTGCICRIQSNLESAFTKICSNIGCPKASCQKPILPIGSCRESCGSVLTFNYTESYTEQKMREYVRTYTTDPEYAGSHAAISKISSNMINIRPCASKEDKKLTGFLAPGQPEIQILVTDEESGSKSGSIAKRMAEELYKDLSSSDNTLGISTIHMQSSGPGQAAPSGLDAGAIAGIVIGTLIGLLCIVGLSLYIIRSGPLRGKKYHMTFELTDADGDKGRDIFPTINEVGAGPEFESTDDNPNPTKSALYGATVESIGGPQRSAMESDFGISFGNPTYDGEDL